MSEYVPDRWVVITITNKETGKSHQRVFAGWYGGYTGGDSWQMNSGITKVRDTGSHYEFDGQSGSVYKCHKESYGMSGYMSGVLQWHMEDAKDYAEITIDESYKYDF